MNLQMNLKQQKDGIFKCIVLLSSILLMKASIIDTNTVTDVSIKYIFP